MTTPAGNYIHEMGVCSIVQTVAEGKLKPIDLVETLLSRIMTFEDQVQAWSHLDTENALEQATLLTAEANTGKLRGPLHGVPIGIKDEFHVQGMPTGLRNLKRPFPEPEDATPVARLRAAGAVIIGKTHMPVGGIMPPTRNPWNLHHTAGGTSSGSGAAVGARMIPVALGEQTGGSNLRPAAYCGVDAIKPTYGRISRFGCLPFAWTMDHVGIIGLSMEDIALVLSVIAGPDPRDPTTLSDPAPPANPASAINCWAAATSNPWYCFRSAGATASGNPGMSMPYDGLPASTPTIFSMIAGRSSALANACLTLTSSNGAESKSKNR